jgi:hypothetical protein
MAIPTRSPLLKPPRVEFVEAGVAFGDDVVLVGIVLEPVSTPVPVLAGPPVTAGIVADPPNGVTDVPPYWLTCGFKGQLMSNDRNICQGPTIVAKSDCATDISADSQKPKP